MTHGFRQAYAALTGFTAHHPEIEIGDSVVSIPEPVRTEFYGFFNTARDAFVEEQFPDHLQRAALLSESYREAEERARGWFSVEDTAVASRVQRFLRDPKGSLARELFDPLFDLLKGREDGDSFEKKASGRIEAFFPEVFREGYEKWVVLSLAGLLTVATAFRVNVRNLNPGERAKSAPYAPFEDVPSPQESTRFFLSQPPSTVFAVPDFIVHSRRLNQCVGVRTGFKAGLHNASNASPEREWCPVDTDLRVLLESGPTLLYAARRPEAIALVADIAKCCRPDLVLWCIDPRLLAREETWERIRRVDGRLKPHGGSYGVAVDPWPECSERAEPDPGIRILTVGFDESRLMPLVEALAAACGPPCDTGPGGVHGAP